MPRVETILMMARSARNQEVLATILGKVGYQTAFVVELDSLESALSEEPTPDLVLVDLVGYDQRIWAKCEMMRQRGVPFLVIAPRQNPVIQQESYARGARGFLVKPLAARSLVQLIRGMLAGSENDPLVPAEMQ